MLGFFPHPYPDELFYSLCARFSDRMRYPSVTTIMTDLFGSRNLRASIDLPSHLNALTVRLPPNHPLTVESIIYRHTLFPLYAPFLPPERAAQVQTAMANGLGATIHGRVGLRAWKGTIHHELRLCPECVHSDQINYNEIYWHRAHQAPEVLVCPQHETCLLHYDLRAFQGGSDSGLLSAERAQALAAKPAELKANEDEYQILIALARNVDWLLTHHVSSPGLAFLRQRYLNALKAKEWVNQRGRIRAENLEMGFSEDYSASLLRVLKCDFSNSESYSWLQRLVLFIRNAHPPVRHLLLADFLAIPVSELFTEVVEVPPFGVGPFPCLNPVCKHYRQLVIQTIEIVYSRYTNGRPIGTFVCECGYAYARTGPDSTQVHQYEIGRIVAFGPLWEKALRKKWSDASQSLRSIAKNLGVNARTIQFQAARLKLDFPRPGSRGGKWAFRKKRNMPANHAEHVKHRALYRRVWQEKRRAYPKATCSTLRRGLSREYSWLYRHDREWLIAHQPARPEPITQPTRVDWTARDDHLSQQVHSAAQVILQHLKRPQRLTIALLGREIGALNLLQQHLAKLPKTRSVLASVVETGEVFAVRRIQWWAKHYQALGFRPPRWKFVHDAGVERWLTTLSVVQALEEALNKLSNHNEV